jgi:AAA domain
MNTSIPSNPKPPSPLKILLIGDPGTHKTWFGLQFPAVHVLDCDRNLDGPVKVIREGFGKVLPPNKDFTFTWDDIRSNDKGEIIDVSECFDRVSDILMRFQTIKEYKERKTVFVDSLSHVNEFIIRKILKIKNEPSMKMQLWTDFASGAYTLLVAKLEQTGKTIICSCHEEKVWETDKTEMMKKNLTGVNPLFSGRVGDNLGAFFTDVWRLVSRPAPLDRVETILCAQPTTKCTILKNSVGMPAEVDVTKGFSAIEPFLKGRI